MAKDKKDDKEETSGFDLLEYIGNNGVYQVLTIYATFWRLRNVMWRNYDVFFLFLGHFVSDVGSYGVFWSGLAHN